MIYKSKQGDLDLTKVTRLYPAVVIDMQGEIAEMSLEWMQSNGDKVKLLHYVLVFDMTPLTEEVKNKKTLTFATREELITQMTEVARFFDN